MTDAASSRRLGGGTGLARLADARVRRGVHSAARASRAFFVFHGLQGSEKSCKKDGIIPRDTRVAFCKMILHNAARVSRAFAWMCAGRLSSAMSVLIRAAAKACAAVCRRRPGDGIRKTARSFGSVGRRPLLVLVLQVTTVANMSAASRLSAARGRGGICPRTARRKPPTTTLPQ